MTMTLTRYATVVTFVVCLALPVGSLPADTSGINYSFIQPGVVPYWPNLSLRAGGLALADFNGDGKIDAAVPGLYIAGAAIVLNGGTEAWFNTGPWPAAVAAADLDGDVDVDLAIAEQDGGGVAILTNNGPGAMTRTAFYPTGLGPQAVAVVDLDKDGLADLVVANRFSDTVVVLRRTSVGFALAQTIAVTGEPCALAVADLDGDTWPDVAVACAAEDSVKILTNTAGTLGAPAAFDAGPYPVAIAAADLDGDGDMDLVVADRELPQVTVLLNSGDGHTWTVTDAPLLAPGYGAFDPPVDVQLADVNYDGFIDIRSAGKTLLNDGAGHFSLFGASQPWTGAVYARTQLPSEPSPFLGVIYGNRIQVNAQVAGDINGDGHVNVLDVLKLAASWGLSIGQTGYTAAADINMNGIVDTVDLLLLAGNWGL